MNVRSSVRNLLPAELTRLSSAYDQMMSINNNRSYSYLAGIYGIPHNKWASIQAEIVRKSDPNFRLFLPWNRAYLLRFEQHLQYAQNDPMITLPWWDWTSDESRREGIPKAFSDQNINGIRNPLNSFHVKLPDSINLDDFIDRTVCPKSREYDTHREEGSPHLLPTTQDIDTLLNLTNYGDFSDGLEDIHNGIHGWVGGRCGDMSYVTFAAYDPIFWSHHSTVDRIFWLWQMMPGHSLPSYLDNIVLDPFELTVRQVLNIYQLGYVYSIQYSNNEPDVPLTKEETEQLVMEPIIRLKSESQVAETTSDIFRDLKPQAMTVMKTIEESMLKHFKDWVALYPRTSDSPDEFVNLKIKQKVDEIANDMCKDFNTIVEYMKGPPIEKDISDYYPGIRQICRSIKKD